MSKNLNKVLTENVLNNIPQNIKPVDYITDILDIGRESGYRRIRGEIPFSFEEVSKLSLELGFSIDEVIGQNKHKRIFFDFENDSTLDPHDTFTIMLNGYYNHIMNMFRAKEVESIIALNKFMIIFSIGSDNLFRFFYYKWIHQTQDVPMNYYYADVVVPSDIKILYNKIKYYMQFIGNTTYIIDKYIYLNVFKEIHYYYKRKLITNEELQILRAELADLLTATEKLVQKGMNNFNSPSFFYLSSLNIEANASYNQYDNNTITHFWVYPVNPIVITNKDVCMMQKQWLESLKKYSTLITKSNEVVQAEFFNIQHDYLDRMGTDEFDSL